MIISEEVYWKVGGPCDEFIDLATVKEISENIIKKNVLFVGRGSNLLFDSVGYKGSILRLGTNFSKIAITSGFCVVGAGYFVPFMVRALSKLGYGGLEHCVGIPATLGGLVVMNGGSQRKFISEHLVYVDYIDDTGTLVRIKKEDCLFGYRNSIFKHKKCCIISVAFNFPKIICNDNRKELLSILTTRRRKFPRKLPSCGSVFISDASKYESIGPPGMIIEKLGLKGKIIGGAQISEIHGNFIVNRGNASSVDILSLVAHINNEIHKNHNFKLKAEAIYVDIDGVKRSLDKAAELLLKTEDV